jgi:ketosteroid isomerase-like protein
MKSDTEAIVRLTHDYAFYNDTFDLDALVALFVDGAYFDMQPAGLDRYDGVPAIREFFERERRALSHVVHFTSNHRVDVDGDEATGTAYFHAIGITRRAGAENQARGYYDDQYVRTAAGWRFRSRRSVPLLPWTPIRKPSDSAS